MITRPVLGDNTPRIMDDWGQRSCRGPAGRHLLILDDPGAAEKVTGGSAAPSAPALIVHSVSDDVIPCRTGRALAGRWCAQGAGHVCGYVTSQPHILSFLQARFYGRAPVSTCARL